MGKGVLGLHEEMTKRAELNDITPGKVRDYGSYLKIRASEIVERRTI